MEHIEKVKDMMSCISSNNLVSKDEAKDIIQSIRLERYRKGYQLIKEGDIVKNCYYIIIGCVRQFQIIDGTEKTTAFYTEGQGIPSFVYKTKNESSNYYLECLEESSLALIPLDKEIELYKKYPNFESLSREGLEGQLAEYQEKMSKFITLKPEERYLDILKNNPDLVNRVPQYHLASYLGVSPETLSRIRKRIANKH